MVFIELIAGFSAQIPTRQQYDKRDDTEVSWREENWWQENENSLEF